MAPKQTDPQFKLRMTPEIKEKIETAAAENKRTMNAEILARLEDFPRIASLEATVGRLEQDIKALETEVETLRKENRENFSRANVYEKRLLVSEAEQKRLEKQNAHILRSNEHLSDLLRSASDLSDKIADAEARANKFESLLRQARTHLNAIRHERDKLAHYVQAINEGVEDDVTGRLNIDKLDDRSLLMKIYYETMRLSSEMVMQRGHFGTPPAFDDENE